MVNFVLLMIYAVALGTGSWGLVAAIAAIWVAQALNARSRRGGKPGLFGFYAGRSWVRPHGYAVTFWIAPWPLDEQVVGEHLRALFSGGVIIDFTRKRWLAFGFGGTDPALRPIGHNA